MIVDQPEIIVVSKSWGFEKWITNTEKYCGKLLYFVKGKKCSLHYHKLKDETFYVQSGKIVVYYHDNVDVIKNTVKNADPARLSSLLYNGDLVRWDSSATPKPEGLQKIVLKRGDNFYAPAMRVHQMLALEDTELYEFSTQHFDTDSYRIIKGD